MKKKILFSFIPIIILSMSICGYYMYNAQMYENIPKHRIQWWLDEINWNKQRLRYTGDGIKIALIDSGVDSDHSDLVGKIKSEKTLCDSSETSKNINTGHGTAVAGIIVAEPSNENGVLGIAPGANIISIDVTDDDNGFVEPSTFVAAIEYAIEQQVQIINVSLGFPTYDKKIEDVVKKALNMGIIIVAATGNTDGEVLYPAAIDGVIGVCSYNKKGVPMVAPSGKENIIYLPGEYIVTTYLNNGYVSASGSSISTPILSGIIALILEKKPECSSNEIVDLILNQKNFDVIKILNSIN